MRRLLPLLLLPILLLPVLLSLMPLLAAPARAQIQAGAPPDAPQPPPILLAMRARAWKLAEAIAAADADPLAVKLVTFIRLLMPTQASAAELRDFITANPGWPDQPVLQQRFAEALADDPDEREVARLCAGRSPPAAPALPRCAAALALAGQDAAAGSDARLAWIEGVVDPAQEADFLARWGQALTPRDQMRRFDRLLATDQTAARRQLARLDSGARQLGSAELALRADAPDALADLAAVPPELRADPTLLLAEARYLRRTHAIAAALTLWRSALPAAEAAAEPGRRPAFWAERDALARDLLAQNDAAGAYEVADDRTLSPEQAVDAEFLAGWIALRRLNDPATARAKFTALGSGAHSAITAARAAYWLGRAASTPADAQAAFARAAAWPLTYYGQLASQAARQGVPLGERILARHDPVATTAEAREFAASEMARAAAILVSWDDKRRAADFLLRAAQPPAGAAARTLAAQMALRLGLPDVAVQDARLAGRDGIVLATSGWPIPVQPPAGSVPPALALGLMRQESSFDPRIVSAAGACGLMQLMPATAQQIARRLHAPSGPLADPDINMRLGTAYLGGLLQRFGGVVPYATAAYDAGPRHVQDWIAGNGDAAAQHDPAAMVDWIELIPFGETRNYVQRVLENTQIYAARLGAARAPGAP